MKFIQALIFTQQNVEFGRNVGHFVINLIASMVVLHAHVKLLFEKFNFLKKLFRKLFVEELFFFYEKEKHDTTMINM